MIGEVGIGAGQRFALAIERLGLEFDAIGGEDELGLVGGGFFAFAQSCQRGRDLAGLADLDVNITTLENPADVGLVGVSVLQPLEGGRLVAESFQKSIGKGFRIERLLREAGDGFFDFNGVHCRGEIASFSGPGKCL